MGFGKYELGGILSPLLSLPDDGWRTGVEVAIRAFPFETGGHLDKDLMVGNPHNAHLKRIHKDP